MKKQAICFWLMLLLTACAGKELPFYEREYALPFEAQEWAENADLADLCQGTKNWRIDVVKNAALNEIKARGLNTKECYYTGMQLTP